MNHIYRIVKNRKSGCYVVVSELARGKAKSSSSTLSLLHGAGTSFFSASLFILSGTASASGPIMHDGTAGNYTGEYVITTENDQTGYGVFSTGEGGNISFIDGSISTTGNNASGVVTSNGGAVDIDNTNIITIGSSANGAHADSGSGVLNISSSKITTTGTLAKGVHSAGGRAEVYNTEITTSGQSAYALSSMSGGGNILFKDGTINTSGRYGIGAFATGEGNSIDITDSKINTSGSGAPGVYVTYGGAVNLNNTDVHANVTYALQADSNSIINFDGGTISSNGNAEAIFARSGGKINIKNATVNTPGYGFTGTSGTEFNADNVIFNVTGTKVGVYGYAYSNINLNNTQLNMNGSNQTGIQLRDHSVATLNDVTINALNNWDGIVLGAETSLNATNLQVNMSSATDGSSRPARGLMMGSGGGTGSASLTNSVIHVAGNTGTALTSNAGNQTLNLINSQLIASEGNGVDARAGATMLINASGSRISGANLVSAASNSSTTLIGKEGSEFAGNIFNSGGTVNIELDSASKWKGSADSLQKLSLKDASTWKVSGNSFAEAMNLDNSTVDLHASSDGFNTLTVG
ncbi:ESPR-type extended signal peptide-containing protein [Pantoea agglomerans]